MPRVVSDGRWTQSARHQSCLDSSDRECPDDRFTGCECHTCAPFHGSVSQEGISACYQAVRDADARIDRVNQVLSSVGTSSRELLSRHLVENQIRRAMGEPRLKLLDALGLVSAVARSNDGIVRELIALRESVTQGILRRRSLISPTFSNGSAGVDLPRTTPLRY